MPERLEQEVDACGAAYVILALDLGTFLTPASRDALLQLRGRKEFDDFLEKFKPQDPRFERDAYYTEVEQRGYELGVFNRILAEDNFAPTYRLIKDRVNFPAELETNVQFKDKFLNVWRKWAFWLRLSSNGIITLIFKLDFPKPRELIYISRDVMGLQGYFDMDSARKKLAELQIRRLDEETKQRTKSVQQFIDWTARHAMVDVEREYPPVVWQMAVEVVHQFVDACGGHLRSESGPLPFELELTPEPNRNGAGALREQYTIFCFHEMGHYDWSAKRRRVLLPDELLSEPYAQTISGLLEGVVIKGKSAYYYPTHCAEYTQGVISSDQSSWKDELCILTERSAFIYPYMPKESRRVVFSSRHIPHSEYWETILRGIEFGVETRLLVQLAEQMTSSYLAEALLLLRSDESLSQKHLRTFDISAANAARLVAHLRTITAPHLIAQASYAVSKFDLFIKQTGIPGILAHAESNLADLTSLLERNYDLLLQIESQRMNELALAISIIFAGLTLSLGILALPSFIADWEQQRAGYLSHYWIYPYLSRIGGILVILLAISGAMAFALAIFTFFRVRRRRKPHLW
jgi:hypothetical protein